MANRRTGTAVPRLAQRVTIEPTSLPWDGVDPTDAAAAIEMEMEHGEGDRAEGQGKGGDRDA